MRNKSFEINFFNMIRIKKRFHTIILNADTICSKDKWRMCVYGAYTGKKSFGFVGGKKTTIHVDLRQNDEDLLKGCKSNTRNEIRKGIKEGYTIESIDNPDKFVTYYNDFACEKNLGRITINDLICYKNLHIYSSVFNGVPLTMHASYGDKETGIVSLLYSASVRLHEGIDRKSVGISNRFLHYQEFLKFRDLDYKIYDFSGVCLDENKPEKFSIGQFKQSFGGNIVEYYNLYSLPMWILMKIFNKE